MNKEYFVNAVHETALITSLALVHTARRFYRLINKVRNKEGLMQRSLEFFQIIFIRGRRSRNKVSVDESAEGSLMNENWDEIYI